LSGSNWLGRIMKRYLRWIYGKCDHVFAPSQATSDMLTRTGIDPAKLAIWRRGVSTTRFDPARRSTALRERWGVSERRPALLYVGRLSREKGLAMFPSFSQHLQYAAVDHRLVFVGDGPMRRELEGCCPTAVFCGTLDPDDVAMAMASSDVFVFPSRTDTAGNVVLERRRAAYRCWSAHSEGLTKTWCQDSLDSCAAIPSNSSARPRVSFAASAGAGNSASGRATTR
jgi:glycosyltransferase involved in cell wall biosynthesis